MNFAQLYAIAATLQDDEDEATRVACAQTIKVACMVPMYAVGAELGVDDVWKTEAKEVIVGIAAALPQLINNDMEGQLTEAMQVAAEAFGTVDLAA